LEPAARRAASKANRSGVRSTRKLGSTRKLAALGDQRGHHGFLLAAFAQSGDDAGAINLGPILADLPFAFDARDRNLDADDALDLRGEILLRRVVDLPRLRQLALPRVGEILDLTTKPGRVLDDLRRAPRVYRHIVPGRYDFAVLLLGRIEGRR